MRIRRPPSIAATVVAALVLAACGSGGASPTSDSTGSDAATQDGAEATAEAAGALLGILEPGVDVADEPVDPTAAAFRSGEDGEGLVVGDLVRTDAAGFAEVHWFDGALARVDADSLYGLVDLDTTPGEAVVVTELDAGRIWNRLRADVAETYEVRTDVGTAAVRGTAFWVACDGDCTFAVLEGTVEVTTTDGTVVTLEAGQQVTVDDGGVPDAAGTADFDDPWVVRNTELDEDAGFDALEPASPATAAGGCPLVDVPDGWISEAHPDTSLAAADFCRYVRPDAGANGFAVIEWYAEDNDEFRTLTDRNRPFYEQFRDEIATSDCGDGMREEFVEVAEPLGRGELYAYAWRVARGPLPASFEECTSGVGNSFHGVVVGGQVFALRPAEVPIDCPAVAAEQTAEEWNAHVDCLFARFTERQAAYRELAAVLLGA